MISNTDCRKEGCVTKADEQYGLTKRELFAAMALQGILASCSTKESQEDAIRISGISGNSLSEHFAFLSVCAADGLIAELEKPK